MIPRRRRCARCCAYADRTVGSVSSPPGTSWRGPLDAPHRRSPGASRRTCADRSGGRGRPRAPTSLQSTQDAQNAREVARDPRAPRKDAQASRSGPEGLIGPRPPGGGLPGSPGCLGRTPSAPGTPAGRDGAPDAEGKRAHASGASQSGESEPVDLIRAAVSASHRSQQFSTRWTALARSPRGSCNNETGPEGKNPSGPVSYCSAVQCAAQCTTFSYGVR